MSGLRSRRNAQAEGIPTNGSSRAAEMLPIAAGSAAVRRGARLARRGDGTESGWSPPSGASLRASSRAPGDSPLQRQVADRERLAADERAQREGNKEKRRRESTAVHADFTAVDELEDDLDEEEEEEEAEEPLTGQISDAMRRQRSRCVRSRQSRTQRMMPRRPPRLGGRRRMTGSGPTCVHAPRVTGP